MLISEFSWKSRSRVTALQNARTNWTWRDEAASRGFAFQKELHFHGDDAMKPPASVLRRRRAGSVRVAEVSRLPAVTKFFRECMVRLAVFHDRNFFFFFWWREFCDFWDFWRILSGLLIRISWDLWFVCALTL